MGIKNAKVCAEFSKEGKIAKELSAKVFSKTVSKKSLLLVYSKRLLSGV